MVKIIALIPARLASTRFPRKVLVPIKGLPMAEHVRRRALLSDKLADVYIVTCDNEIADLITNFGGKVIMTHDKHENGTSRVAEAAKKLDCSHVMLLQGDEPLLLPDHVSRVNDSIIKYPDYSAWNITAPLRSESELERHSFVKCSVTENNRILYCFRKSPAISKFSEQQSYIRKMLGVIAFRKDFLLKITDTLETKIEKTESIEQMRIIENGQSLFSVPVNESLPSVNEPSDLDEVHECLESDEYQKMLVSKILN